MEREITTGAYWFYRRRFDLSAMNMELALDRRVDGAVLQAAAERAIRRYPCLKLTWVEKEDGTQFLLTENTEPFRVVENAGFVSLEGPAANGYLWTLGYWENRLYLSMFHGLTDGLGLAAVMRGILCYYYAALTGSPLPRALAETLEAAPSGLEYADPFAYARLCEPGFPFRVPEAVLLEPEDADTYIPCHRRVLLSLREVLSLSKQTEGNVSGIISLLLARAVDNRNDDPAKCVVVKCPINLRPLLGCAETLQNCVSSLKYVYSPKVRKMPFPVQASCFKGMLMIQSTEETLMNSFYEWKFDVLRFNRESSIEEKREMFRVPEAMYPMVSYLGGFSVGEYDKYIRDVAVSLDVCGGIGVIALSLGDKLYLNLMLSEKTKAFVGAVTDALDELGLSYTVA